MAIGETSRPESAEVELKEATPETAPAAAADPAVAAVVFPAALDTGAMASVAGRPTMTGGGVLER